MVEAARPMRPKARKSPPSLMTIAEASSLSWMAASSLFGCRRPSLPFGGRGHRVAQLGGALLVARAQLRRPIAGRPLHADCLPRRPCAPSAAAGDAQISTTPRRLSRNSPRDIADAHEPSITEHGGRAEGELEIETAADGQHDVRVTHARPPRMAADHRGMRVRQPARGFHRCRGRRRAAVEQLNELRSGTPGAPPRDH